LGVVLGGGAVDLVWPKPRQSPSKTGWSGPRNQNNGPCLLQIAHPGGHWDGPRYCQPTEGITPSNGAVELAIRGTFCTASARTNSPGRQRHG
jgi:hypothetical protein